MIVLILALLSINKILYCFFAFRSYTIINSSVAPFIESKNSNIFYKVNSRLNYDRADHYLKELSKGKREVLKCYELARIRI